MNMNQNHHENSGRRWPETRRAAIQTAAIAMAAIVARRTSAGELQVKPSLAPLWCGQAGGHSQLVELRAPGQAPALVPGLALVFQGSQSSKGGVKLALHGSEARPLYCSRIVPGMIYQVVYDGTRFRAMESSSAFNVRLFGAVGDDMTDDTEAIQAALTAAASANYGGYGTGLGAVVELPQGCYRVSRTLKMSQNVWLRGEGVNTTQIHRVADYGDTLQVSDENKGSAQATRISGIWFQHASATDKLDNVATHGAHIRIYQPQWAVVEECWINRMQYGLVFEGGSVTRISNCSFGGVWDPEEPRNQEQIAAIAYNAHEKFGNPTSAVVTGCQFNGAGVSRSTTLRASDGEKTIPNFGNLIGAQSAVRIQGLEDGTFTDNFLGGYSSAGIDIRPAGKGGVIDLRIANNMFDGIAGSAIRFHAQDAAHAALNTTITGNVFNGELNGAQGIVIDPNEQDRGPSACGVTLTGNTFNAHYKTPVAIGGAAGFVVANNSITNYNSLGVSKSDPEWINAIYVFGASRDGIISGNLVGGGGNLFEKPANNFCYGAIRLAAGVNSVSVTNNMHVGTGPDRQRVGLAVSENQRVVGPGEIEVAPGEDTILVNRSMPTPTTLRLPRHSPVGRIVTVADIHGDAGRSPITILAGEGASLSGVESDSISTPFGSRTYRFNGATWNRIA